MSGFEFSEIQANAILDMRLARLAALERKKIEDEFNEVLNEIAALEALLADPAKILGRSSGRHGRAQGEVRRRAPHPHPGCLRHALTEEDLIPEVDVLVTITNKGYVKRIADDVYRTQHRGGRA